MFRLLMSMRRSVSSVLVPFGLAIDKGVLGRRAACVVPAASVRAKASRLPRAIMRPILIASSSSRDLMSETGPQAEAHQARIRIQPRVRLRQSIQTQAVLALARGVVEVALAVVGVEQARGLRRVRRGVHRHRISGVERVEDPDEGANLDAG